MLCPSTYQKKTLNPLLHVLQVLQVINRHVIHVMDVTPPPEDKTAQTPIVSICFIEGLVGNSKNK